MIHGTWIIYSPDSWLSSRLATASLSWLDTTFHHQWQNLWRVRDNEMSVCVFLFVTDLLLYTFTCVTPEPNYVMVSSHQISLVE